MKDRNLKNFIKKNKIKIIIITLAGLILALTVLAVIFLERESLDNNTIVENNVNPTESSEPSPEENSPTPESNPTPQEQQTPNTPNTPSTSSGSTSTPSGGNNGGGSTPSVPSTTPSASGGGSTQTPSNQPPYAPFQHYKQVRRQDKENQAIAWIKEELQRNGFMQYVTSIEHGSGVPSGRGYSTFSERNAKAKVTGGWSGAIHVYVEDLYMSDSGGYPTNTPADVAMYIW